MNELLSPGGMENAQKPQSEREMWDGLVKLYEEDAAKAMAEYERLTKRADVRLQQKLKITEDFASEVFRDIMKARRAGDAETDKRSVELYLGLVSRAKDLQEEIAYGGSTEESQLAYRIVTELESQIAEAKKERDAT